MDEAASIIPRALNRIDAILNEPGVTLGDIVSAIQRETAWAAREWIRLRLMGAQFVLLSDGQEGLVLRRNMDSVTVELPDGSIRVVSHKEIRLPS